MGSFEYRSHRITYDEYGAGDRVLVLTHGLLMNRRMYDGLGPEMAARGHRVICVDLLGHGRSDRPIDVQLYGMSSFADQLAALLDHLGLDEAVIGGTSLGANVSLELTARHPDRVRGLFIEMPVLDNALLAVAMIFTPVMATLRFGRVPLRLVSVLTQRIPRTVTLVDVGLDWVRQEPGPSLAVLEGLLIERTCPPHSERVGFEPAAIVVGHSGDPLHPFSDSGMLADEMPNARLINANSILEWRLNPRRLNDELAAFLTEVWEAPELAAARAKRAGDAPGGNGQPPQAVADA
ncbi:MAG: alpha/beta fold hydrolase [Solirubrobacterales bacterium]